LPWRHAVTRKFSDATDVELIGKPILATTKGLELADSLSIEHIEEALKSLSQVILPSSTEKVSDLL